MNNEMENSKAEKVKIPENNQENEFSIDDINDVLKQKTDVFDSLNKFSKDSLFKGYDLRGNIEVRDKAEDKYDSDAYAKAGLWKKFLSFVAPKEFLGLVKTKDRGIVDKNTIENYVEGRIFRLGDRNKGVYKHEEEKVAKKFNLTEEESKGRVVTKTYEFTNGKIEKLIKSSRTEEGMIDFAGKIRTDMISTIDQKLGVDLVGLKESVEKNKQTKENMLKMSGFMSETEKQILTDKLDKEEANKKEKIKEKEEKIAEQLNIFREPFEARLKETSEMENNLSEVFDFIKINESNLNKNIKECEVFIAETQKLNLSDEMRADIIKNAEAQKVVLSVRVKEFTEKKELVSSKLELLKNNKKEIEATLSRVNNIGKTKKEIGQEKKETKGKDKETKTETKSTENKKGGTESADTKKDKDSEKEKKTWDETRDEAWGLKGAEAQQRDKESEDEEEIKGEEYKEKKEVFNDKEVEDIVMKELKAVGFMNNKKIDEKRKSLLVKHLMGAVKNEIIKSGGEITEDFTKNEVGDWYKKLIKNFNKNVK